MLIIISCGGDTKEQSAKSTADQSEVAKSSGGASTGSSNAAASASNGKGKLIYKQYCVICHGADGKLGVSEAKDLSASTISLEERINQITNGKGLMTPYKDILSEDQILAVAEYLDELKQ